MNEEKRKHWVLPGVMGLFVGIILLFLPGFKYWGNLFPQIRKTRVGSRANSQASLSGVVMGRSIQNDLVPLSGAQVFLRDIKNKNNTFMAKADKKGRYEIPALPFGNYLVSVVQPGRKYFSYCGIESSSFCFPRDGAETKPGYIHKNWFLNQCRVLTGAVYDEKSGKQIKRFEALALYYRLDVERVFDWDDSKATVALLGSDSYAVRVFPYWKDGTFKIRICWNSRGHGFDRFLGKVVFKAPGYKSKELKGNWEKLVLGNRQEGLKVELSRDMGNKK